MAVALGVGTFLIAAANGALDTLPYLFLLPWIAGLAVVMGIPSAYLYYRGEFTIANPIVFATVSYFGPACVVGGILLASGYSEPYYLSFIQDPRSDLPFTIVLIGIGFASLSIGYFVPFGAKIGTFVSRILPEADYSPRSFVIPGLLLLVLGVGNTVFALTIGLFGYQFSSESTTYAGLIYLATLFRVEAAFLLWVVIFRQPKFTALSIAVIVLLGMVDLTSALFAGNRGMILQVISVILMAFVLSGRRFKFIHGVICVAVLTVGIIVGMIYGSTFRMVKGNEAQQSVSEYSGNIIKTLDEVGRANTYESVSFGLARLAERLDIVSTVAVVVSNYEQLKPYEEAYGLDNNIWIDTTTFLIPRIIWVEKPTASDARRYSDLYFNTADSSFAITPIGDLLRNFGVIGVPIGMFILGMILRFLYSTLIVPGKTPVWRATVYFLILTSVSYEGFYGTILPTMFKVAFTALLGVLLVCIFAKKLEAREQVSSI